MSLASRVGRLEAKAGSNEGPIVTVGEDADGGWYDLHTGERVEPAAVPANARVIVFAVREDGPQ